MTVAGEDVKRALIGWPRCPICGEWMRSFGEDWFCGGVVLVRWSRRWGWQREARQREEWQDLSEQPAAPRLAPDDDLASVFAVEAAS